MTRRRPRVARAAAAGLAIFAVGAAPFILWFGRAWLSDEIDAVRHSVSAEARHDRRYERVLSELDDQPSHPWAGVYSYATGFDASTIAIAPKAGYAYSQAYDFPSDEFASGGYDKEGNLIRLRGGPPSASDFLFVPWGRRMYLIETWRLNSFVNAINSGSEPRYGKWGRFYLREGDVRLDPEGLPELPPKYRARIRPKPLTARVVRVGARTSERVAGFDHPIVAVTLDVGSEQGVFLEEEFDFAEIIRVYPSSSVARLNLFGDRLPRVGDRFSTGPELPPRINDRIPFDFRFRRVAREAPATGELRWADDAYISAAKKHGLSVRLVVTGTYKPKPGTGDFPDYEVLRPLLEPRLRAYGANCYTEHSLSKVGDPYHASVKGYRIEWKGRPIGKSQFPWQPEGWRWVPLQVRLDENPIHKARQMAFEEAYRQLLHLTREQFADLHNLPLEHLNSEQRKALAELEGIRARTGTYFQGWSAASGRKEDIYRASELARRAVEPVDAALRAHNPRAYAEYEQLQKQLKTAGSL